ncbi:MAG: glycine C-acetyltransferase [Spirochaetaceae bacterium]|nr:glycine C-acetyltransferase [Spirochaetaceae bacterium]MDT8297993.1 glycine C-acetyltransferase [Spirochaetaceae bacterium]
MNAEFHAKWSDSNTAMVENGTWKTLRHLEGPMSARTRMENRGEVVILSSNNYLGLANHPDVVAASKAGLDMYGAGTASVRFICGTFTIHRELEKALADLSGTEAALSYVSCWSANTGAIPLLASQGDVIVSDELNHASIIDGIRLSKAERRIYKHSDMKNLESKLTEARKIKGEGGSILVITDGVFSMEGDLARLPDILEIAGRFGAAVMVDDSHATGVLGPHGRGTPEHYGLEGQIDIITGTLGKALGGAAGGYVASSRAVVDALIQSSRPQIFSNALPASVAAGALEAVRLLRGDAALLARLRENTHTLRNGLKSMGFNPLEGESGIIPIIVGQTSFAIDMSAKLLDRGVFVTGFGFPVVPEGTARIRVQSSAALTKGDIEKALDAFSAVGRELGLI